MHTVPARKLALVLFTTSLIALAGGVALAEGQGQTHHGHKGAGIQHGKHGGGHKTHGMRHHRGGQGGQAARHLFGQGWRATLNVEQKAALDKLHVIYAKNKAQLKAMIQGLKTQLSVLATADAPQTEALSVKIEELLGVKREMLTTKYEYIAAQRVVLTPEQRISFDMEVIHRAMHGKKGGRAHAGGH